MAKIEAVTPRRPDSNDGAELAAGKQLVADAVGQVLAVGMRHSQNDDLIGPDVTSTRLYGSPLRRALEPASRRLARAAVRAADAIRTVSPFTSDLVRRAGGEPTATFTTYFDVSAFAAAPVCPVAGAVVGFTAAVPLFGVCAGSVGAGGAVGVRISLCFFTCTFCSDPA